jgi:chloramphenicol 3-O-phosphotransferase
MLGDVVHPAGWMAPCCRCLCALTVLSVKGEADKQVMERREARSMTPFEL